MKHFSENLKKLRIKNNESQKDLATILNISFQSVSKWEQGVHYPDVIMLKDIAKHYNVSIDYLLGMEEIEEVRKEHKQKVSVNTKGGVSVWTDFTHLDTIAPVSELDKDRHAPGNRFLKTHPGPKETIVIAVDKDNKICLLGQHINNRFPSCGPGGFIYTRTGQESYDNPCFIFEDGYEMGNLAGDAAKKFEFVIPEGGMVAVFPSKCVEIKEILKFILRNKFSEEIMKYDYFNDKNYFNNNNYFLSQNLFRDNLLSGELDNITISLVEDELVFSKIESIEEIAEDNNYSGISEFTKLKNKVDRLIIDINNLEAKIMELDGRTINSENEIDDLRNDLDCFEDDLDELKDSEIEELKNMIEEIKDMIE